MVLFDSSVLLLLLDPKTPAPLDPATRQPIARTKERIELLIHKLQQEDQKIIIPTPVISEILVRAGNAGAHYIQIFEGSASFKIAPFDTRAAIEVASMARDVSAKGRKKLDPAILHAKLKYDRQIVAIGITENVTAIYSDDNDLRTLAQTHHIKPYGIADLPLPATMPQTSLIDEIHRLSDQ